MKKIEAIVRLSRFESIRDALAGIGVNFFTLTEVKGFGLQKGEQLMYRGSVYDSDYIARLRIDIFCNTEKVDEIIDAIVSSGRTGEVGDGKIIVIDLEHVVRIRTFEIGAEAIQFSSDPEGSPYPPTRFLSTNYENQRDKSTALKTRCLVRA